MAFLNRDLMQNGLLSVRDEIHPLLKGRELPLNVRLAYLQGCIIACLEASTDGSIPHHGQNALVNLGVSLGLLTPQVDETIQNVTALRADEQREFMDELFGVLSTDEYAPYFMKDFERIGHIVGLIPAEAVDYFGNALFRCSDWREKMKAYELNRQREVIAAKTYKTGDTKSIVLPGGAEMELIYCSPGSFTMGSSVSGGDDKDELSHEVRLSKGFWLCRYPVTIEQWKSVVLSDAAGIGRVLYSFSADATVKDWGCSLDFIKDSLGNDYDASPKQGGRLPVFGVSWLQCRDFVLKLNQLTGLHARLPSEAEWEYACRAGTQVNRIKDVEKFACTEYYHHICEDISGERVGEPRPVGLGLPNQWGFYDMLGNVKEWCNDVYAHYSGNPETDPVGPLSGAMHVCRGASHGDSLSACRPTRRSKEEESGRDYIGLRLAFDIVEVPQGLTTNRPDACRNDMWKSLSINQLVGRGIGIWNALQERYGREMLMIVSYIIGAVLIVLTIGLLIRWWLATLIAGILTARFGAVINHGGFECLLPMVSLATAVILFFLGV